MTSRGPAFVGRRAELARLREAWQRTVDGRGPRTVAVAGPPGIGKTALVEHFLGSVTGSLVLSVSADRVGFLPPWQLLTDLLERLDRHPDGGSAPRRRPAEFASPNLVGDGLADALRRPGGCVLFVDDAHRADLRSLSTIRHAVTAVREHPLLVVFAYQTGDSLTRLTDATPAPQEPAAWLEHESGIEDRIPLAGLDVGDLLDMAAAMDRPLSMRAAVRLRDHTLGHPFAWQLIDQLSSDALAGATGPLTAPPDVARIVVGRLAALPAGARDVIMAAAVLGRRFGVADLHELCRGQDVADAIDAAVAAGLVEEEPGQSGRRLRFVSTLVRDAAYDQLPRKQRQALHRAAILLSPDGAAWHRVASADGPDPALAAILSDVARDEYRQGHFNLCAQFLVQALEFTPRDDPRRHSRLLRAAELLLLVGDLGRAGALSAELATCPPSPWLDYVAGYLHMVQGRPDEAQETLVRAHTALGGPAAAPPDAPQDLRARICVQIATLGIVTLSYGDITAYAKEALDDASDDAVVTSLAYFTRAVGLALTGRSREALDELAASRAFVTGSGLDALVARGMIRLWTDDLPGAESDLDGAVTRAIGGESLRVGQALAFLGEVHFRRGELREAARVGGWAVDDAIQNRRFWDFALVHGLACYPRAAMGDWAKAEELARLAGTYAWTATGRAYAAAARAGLAQARDDPHQLLEAAEAIVAAYTARESGTSLFGPLRADALSRLGCLDEAAEALAGFVAEFGDGARAARMVIARVEAQIALGRGDPAGADELATRALGHADAVGLPLESARIRLVRARTRHAAGRLLAAERELTVAMAGFTAIEATAYVAQVHRLATELDLPVGQDPLRVLTRAERAVVHLDLRGRSNAEIAEELTLAPKTVENKLRDARRKLEVGRLDEVRDAVVAAGGRR